MRVGTWEGRSKEVREERRGRRQGRKRGAEIGMQKDKGGREEARGLG